MKFYEALKHMEAGEVCSRLKWNYKIKDNHFCVEELHSGWRILNNPDIGAFMRNNWSRHTPPKTKKSFELHEAVLYFAEDKDFELYWISKPFESHGDCTIHYTGKTKTVEVEVEA